MPSLNLPTYPEPLAVRPLTVADLPDEPTADLTVYLRRVHAGEITLDPGLVHAVHSRPVHPRADRPRRSGRTGLTAAQPDPIGFKISIDVRSVYGGETTVHLYDTDAAFDAAYPPADNSDPGSDPDSDRSRAQAADRNRALARRQDPGVYLPDPDGPLHAPLTPAWGAQCTLTLFARDVDPQALIDAVQQALDAAVPEHRLDRIKARPVADRRVNVYRQDHERQMMDGLHEAPRTAVGLNVLEAQAFTLGGSGCLVEPVQPGTPGPVVGD
jgi:hypothetical protein